MSRPPAPHAGPCTVITEQPAGKALRFRYECEGRSAGSIPGVNSTAENRTYPTIKICGYKGRVVVVVSCVTKDEPYKPHPHNLVGRDCAKGVCTVRETISDENNRVAFKNLGIQCVKRRDIAEALRVREELRVDPFKTRYHHKNQPQSIDLNAVRLCFQAFMTDDAGKVKHFIPPVVSDVIYDKKAMSDLQIAQISHCSGPMKGGTRVILLCEKVNREDTAVVFFQEENGRTVWEDRAHIETVHKQVAIVFHTPAYRYPQMQEHVNVQLRLQRLTDAACSAPVGFEYIPARNCPPDGDYLPNIKRKRTPSMLTDYDIDRFAAESKIKSEPRDKSPLHVNPYEQPWQYELGAGAGPSRGYASPGAGWAGAAWSPPYTPHNMHLAPNLQVPPSLSPNLQQLDQSMSPSPSHMGHNSPVMGHNSPGMGHNSPGMGHNSPGMGHNSPGMGHHSPGLTQISPVPGHISPGMQVSPHHMGHVSPIPPSVGQVTQLQNMQTIPVPVPQQYAPMPPTMMDTTVNSTPSLTSLLQDGAGAVLAVDSTELSSLSNMFADRGPDLSDSLNRLSTSDLLQP